MVSTLLLLSRFDLLKKRFHVRKIFYIEVFNKPPRKREEVSKVDTNDKYNACDIYHFIHMYTHNASFITLHACVIQACTRTSNESGFSLPAGNKM